MLRIVELVRTVDRSASDPFEVDVKKALETLRRHLPNWKALDDLVLDAETLNELSYLVKLQDDWVRHRASSVYVDPALMEIKIRLTPEDELAKCFSGSWHPFVELRQLFPGSLSRAMDYWNELLPLAERFRELGEPLDEAVQGIGMEELVAMRILSEEEFRTKLTGLLREARERLGTNDTMDYWGFVRGRDWEDTVMRAYMTSFLVSGSLLSVEYDHVEDRTYISLPYSDANVGPSKSIVIPLSKDLLKG